MVASSLATLRHGGHVALVAMSPVIRHGIGLRTTMSRCWVGMSRSLAAIVAIIVGLRTLTGSINVTRIGGRHHVKRHVSPALYDNDASI